MRTGVVGVTWTAWHFFFGLVLRKRGPRGLEVRDEVPLSKEPPRLDYLLLHRHDPSSDSDPPVAEDGGPCTLQRLWPLLSRVAVVEYKSPTHPYRSGQLDRLWGYVHIYFANQWAAAGDRSTDVRQSVPRDVRQSVPRDVRQSLPREELSAVLVVARRTPSLDKDIASMALSWDDHGGGYWSVRGGLFALHVVELDVAGPADGDDLLYSLGHGKPTTAAARRFWVELAGSKEAGMSVQDMEGYDDLMQKFLETLPPEQRLAGMPPEQRLAGLDRDHQALALPLELLRLLPDEYLRTLRPEVEAELRRRLAQGDRPGTPRNGH